MPPRRDARGRRRGRLAVGARRRSLLRRNRSRHRDGAAGRRPGDGECLAHRPGSVQEDPGELVADHQPVDQVAGRTERDLVLDPVVNERATVDGFEAVHVLPAPIRTSQLNVAEAVGRIVFGDPRHPTNRDAEQRADAVPDLEARAHRLVIGQVLESHARRRDSIEVARPREEVEDLVAGTRDEQLGRQ